jgi:Protein of unknown function (DUF3606)
MVRRHAKGARNRLDLNDRVQVRIVRKRLKISDRQLNSVVQTVGNSIAAITKEANSRKDLVPVNDLPSTAVVASVQKEGAVEEASPAACQSV